MINPILLPAPRDGYSPLTVLGGQPGTTSRSSPFPFELLGGPDHADRVRRYAWSELLKRSFRRDVLVCSECGGPMRLVAMITAPEVVEKILRHLRLASRAPPPRPPPATAPRGSPLSLANLDGIDPIFPDE